MQSTDKRLAVLEQRLEEIDEGFSEVVDEIRDGPLAQRVQRLFSKIVRLERRLVVGDSCHE